MGVITVKGYIEPADYEMYKKIAELLRDFADKNKFTGLGVEYEEQKAIRPVTPEK